MNNNRRKILARPAMKFRIAECRVAMRR